MTPASRDTRTRTLTRTQTVRTRAVRTRTRQRVCDAWVSSRRAVWSAARRAVHVSRLASSEPAVTPASHAQQQQGIAPIQEEECTRKAYHKKQEGLSLRTTCLPTRASSPCVPFRLRAFSTGPRSSPCRVDVSPRRRSVAPTHTAASPRQPSRRDTKTPRRRSRHAHLLAASQTNGGVRHIFLAGGAGLKTRRGS